MIIFIWVLGFIVSIPEKSLITTQLAYHIECVVIVYQNKAINLFRVVHFPRAGHIKWRKHTICSHFRENVYWGVREKERIVYTKSLQRTGMLGM